MRTRMPDVPNIANLRPPNADITPKTATRMSQMNAAHAYGPFARSFNRVVNPTPVYDPATTSWRAPPIVNHGRNRPTTKRTAPPRSRARHPLHNSYGYAP